MIANNEQNKQLPNELTSRLHVQRYQRKTAGIRDELGYSRNTVAFAER
jgi:hypothetical protein